MSVLVTVVGTVKVASLTGATLVEPAATIVRTRGELLISMDTAIAAGRMTGAFGLINVSADASAIGITAIPGPITDSGLDWYVWVPVNLASLSATEVEDAPLQNYRTLFDSRGMRKVKFGSTLVAVLEITSNVAGVTLDASLGT